MILITNSDFGGNAQVNSVERYNADFDGDEMNIFLPQSIQTQIELEEIADVKRQIITPATSRTIIGIVQDGLIGAYNLTAPNMRIDWKTAMNIMSYTSIDNFKQFKKNKEYTGHELFSMILPPKINVVRKEEDGKQLIIRNGILEQGYVTKDLLGSKKKNNLTQLIWDEYGVDPTQEFLDNTQRLINNFNLYNGFTVGIGDATISSELETQIHRLFETKDVKVAHMITELENNPDLMDHELFERNLFAELNVIREDVSGLLMKNLAPTNNFKIMITSGSKGQPENIAQMSGCVGLQAFEGKLIPKKLNQRTLPYFFRDDDRSSSRGLIKRPFLRGMTFPEFFFHNLTGREGLIDQAIKSVTPDTQIIIIDCNVPKYIKIGDWIDNLLAGNCMVKHYAERDMELLELKPDTVYIPTTDEMGNISWGNIVAVTRHDPGKELYEIKTISGRRVIVTESKSLLIWSEKYHKFLRMSTPDVVVGDFVPVTMKLSAPYQPVKQLDQDTGIFIGLFLACGKITDNHIFIQSNVQNIIHFVERYQSSVTQKFIEYLQQLPFSRIPDTAYQASDEFLKGLINGYFSVKCIVSDSIEISSQYRELLDGIVMMCCRLGIFTQYCSDNKLSITNQWCKIFAKQITLLDDNLNNLISQINTPSTERIINDTVLDMIVEINNIDVTKYPKVYDLTIPDTLNFGIANGLHVVDTSESGYIQRKLVKSMEDAMIRYDGTVRTASNSIIQFIYGDSGADTTKQYEYQMNLITMNDLDISIKHKFTKEELKNFDNYSDQDNDDFYQYMIEKRNLLRASQIKTRMNYITLNTTYMLPVNLIRIIENNRFNTSLRATNEPLDPKYILQQIQDVLDNRNTQLLTLKKNETRESIKYLDDRLAKTALEIALHDSLSPKRCIVEYGLNRAQFDNIMREVVENYNKNLAEPGEMVGIIAAQSLGEPTTQLSEARETHIRLVGKENYSGKIGDFVDNMMDKYKDSLIRMDPKTKNKPIPELKSSVLIMVEDYYIASVSQDEKIEWKRISEISRHPANGKMVRVTTRSGKTTTATLSHSFLKRSDNRIVPVKGSELQTGDRIPIAKNIPVIDNALNEIEVDGYRIELDRDFGWLCGAYIADGSISSSTITISKMAQEFEDNIRRLADRFEYNVTVKYTKNRIIMKNYPRKYDNRIYDGKSIIFNQQYLAKFFKKNFGIKAINKKLSGLIYATNLEFIRGLIGGYFDGDGNVQYDKKHQSLRAHSKSDQLIDDMCVLINYSGMHGTKGFETQKDQVEYSRKGMYSVIHVPIKYAQKFKDDIGLIVKEKADILDNLIKYNDRDNKHSSREDIDMIPGLGQTIADISKKLQMEGNSRLYGRFTKKEAIGRETLAKFIDNFEKEFIQQTKNYTLNADEYIAANKKELIRRRAVQAKRSKKPIKECKLVYKDVLKVLDPEEAEEIAKKLQILKDAYNSDVVWDEIVKLEILDDPLEYVYDFTVPGLESFMVDTGILVHNTLNSFHHSGIAAISPTTQGVPRVKELLSLTKNLKTPQMIIYLTKEYMASKEMANKIASYIKFTTLGNLRGRMAVYYDPDPRRKNGFMERDNVDKIFFTKSTSKYSCQANIESLPWLMRIEFNRENLFEKEVTLLDIKSKFCSYWEKSHSDKNIKKEEKAVFEKISQMAVLSNTDYDETPIIHIRFDMVDFNIKTLNDFVDYIIDRFKLKGITSISSISSITEERVLTFDNENNDIEKKTQYVIYTVGANLYDIRYLNGIDINRTICNDVIVMYETFGIEAARSTLLREIMYAYERAGSSVNYHHVSVLIDLMTFNGYLTSIDRHGMNKSDVGPLSRASFEKTVDQLQTAAVFGEIDHMDGVSSRIMAGLVIKGGTGLCNLILDTEMIQNSEFTDSDIGQKYVKTYNDIGGNNFMNDIINNTVEENDMFIPT